ncbi:UdgX family uracil-DNA binding protein [Sphingomonas sp.]|uniref:UdgX family uracil-DNA binding protein n=1 Tax=Sphingomonas sp. TaxID=28214 RepID=UPI003B3A0B8E
MHLASLAAEDDFDGWRKEARRFAALNIAPGEIAWRVGDAFGDLLAATADSQPAVGGATPFSVPRPFVDLARMALRHLEPERFGLLYSLLLRIRENPRLLQDQTDVLVRRVELMAKEVRRDIHKMRAFVRFREIGEGEEQRFVAWFEPDHHIVRANAGFFLDRFASMRWSILTPELSLHWDGVTLREAPGAVRSDAPDGDPLEDTWKTYYASIFNPARVKIGAMVKEMPRKYWKNMPETALVPELIASAQARESAMVAASRENLGANATRSWAALRDEAMGCTRCSLFKDATQTVFGEGPLDARLMFVGEQPGDQEDLAGKPFVGPAGQMFDRALAEAGLDRRLSYITNAVKHFKYEQRGKRRIHAKPNAGEIQACRWWYGQERELIRPRVTVAMGATAARQMLGKAVTISGTRGAAHRLEDGSEGWVTVHPSFLLRIQEKEEAEAEYLRFVADLKRVRERVDALS